MLAPWKKSYDQPRQHVKKQRHSFANKGPSSQSYGFSSSHIWMWELDHKEGQAPKNWCFGIVVLKKTLENPLDSKEVKPVLSEVNPEYSLERLMLKLQYLGCLVRRANSWEVCVHTSVPAPLPLFVITHRISRAWGFLGRQPSIPTFSSLWLQQLAFHFPACSF